MKTFFTFFYTILLILLRMRNLSDKSCRKNQNTHFMCHTLLRKSCRLRDNVEKYDAAKVLRYTYIACLVL